MTLYNVETAIFFTFPDYKETIQLIWKLPDFLEDFQIVLNPSKSFPDFPTYISHNFTFPDYMETIQLTWKLSDFFQISMEMIDYPDFPTGLPDLFLVAFGTIAFLKLSGL